MPLKNFTDLKDDGSTAAGVWIYTGIYPAEGVNRAAARVPDDYVSLGWGFAWPANRRILYNRASADPDGKPWSERKRYVWWDRVKHSWVGFDIPDFPATKAPRTPGHWASGGMDAHDGASPFIMKPDGKIWLFTPSGVVDGPLPTHYEPWEGPVGNALYPRHPRNPVARLFNVVGNKYIDPGNTAFPVVITTYRLTEHHVGGAMTRWLPWLAELQPELFVELSPELAHMAWSFPRLACPACGECQHQRLGYLHAEGQAEFRRADVCESCHGYLKAIAVLDPFSPAALLDADLATVALDFAAIERGYHRVATSTRHSYTA